MSAWTSEAVNKFWDAMAGIYGKRFYAEYGEDMPDTWKASVSQLSYAQAKFGIDQCIRSRDQFIPTLPQLMYRARSMPQPQTHSALPRPTVDRDAQRERLKKIMADALKGSGSRCILLPGEGYADYRGALKASGIKEPKFKVQRAAANGWTPEQEIVYRKMAHAIGLRLD